jgi:hypothetical protein
METVTKKSIFKKWWFWVVALVVLGGIFRLTASKETKERWNKEEAAKQAEETAKQAAIDSTKERRISLAKFNVIQIGMTRDQVDAILSPKDSIPDGEDILSVDDIRKLKQDPEADFSIMYHQVNSISGSGNGAAYAKITYRGHTVQRVVDKMQFGLD